MPWIFNKYIRCCDAVTRVVGIGSQYIVLLMTGLLLWSAISRTLLDHPLIWAVESGEFMMTAYYFLGGAYVVMLKGHVRMDVFYTRWPPKRQGLTDVFTDFCLIFYLVFLLIGGIEATHYAVVYDQVKRSVWGPPMWPIKIIMCAGIILMMLQAFSTLFKDIAKARGIEVYTEAEKALAQSRGEAGISGGAEEV